MISDITSKGSKYFAIWILIYITVKCLYGSDISNIDIALTATVITLLMCILENMYYSSCSSSQSDQNDTVSEKFHDTPVNKLHGRNKNTGNTEKQTKTKCQTQLNVLHKKPTIIPHTTMESLVDSLPTVSANESESNNSSCISSSNDSNASTCITRTSNLLKSGAEIGCPTMTLGNRESDILKNIDLGRPTNRDIPNPSSQPLDPSTGIYKNYTSTSRDHNGPYHVVKDYLGNNVLLNKNNFGGTRLLERANLVSGTNCELDEIPNTDNAGDNTNEIDVNVDNHIASCTSTKACPQNGNFEDPEKMVASKIMKYADTARPVRKLNITPPTFGDKAYTNLPDGSGKILISPDSALSTSVASNVSGPMSTVDAHGRSSKTGIKWHEQVFDPRRYFGAENLDQISAGCGRTRNDILVNEMIYSDFNRMPPSFNDKDFEYGYSYLPPKDWYPLPPYPPVCSSNSTCLVQPTYVDNITMNLKEWHETQRFTPPDSINTTFIANELNSNCR